MDCLLSLKGMGWKIPLNLEDVQRDSFRGKDMTKVTSNGWPVI